VKPTVVIVFVGTSFASMCALIQTTLPDGALKPFHEMGLPGIAVPLAGIMLAVGSDGLHRERAVVGSGLGGLRSQQLPNCR
jgi:hypothetical protein